MQGQNKSVLSGGVFYIRAGLARRLVVHVRPVLPPQGTQATSLTIAEIGAVAAGDVCIASPADGPLVGSFFFFVFVFIACLIPFRRALHRCPRPI